MASEPASNGSDERGADANLGVAGQEEVQGFMLTTPEALGACNCGHDLLDHMMADGGCFCRFSEQGACTCTRFQFA